MKFTTIFTVLGLVLFLFTSCEKEEFLAAATPDQAAVNTASLDLTPGDNPNATAKRPERPGSVYVMSNDAAGNEILVLNRRPNGTLGNTKVYPTQGLGSGGGLGSQSAIVVSGNYLFAVNAGSDDFTVFRTTGQALQYVDHASSLGTRPTSLTVSGDLVYVLNAGGDGNISGFRLTKGGLAAIPGSVQSLSSSSAAAAQISFNEAGDQLIVTERATNQITTFPVGSDGVAGPGTAFPSAGITPFGFAISPYGDLIVSEAFGGAAGAGTVSSYALSGSGTVSLVDGPEATNQTAACWIVITQDGEYAYASNTGSNTISGYHLTADGQLELLDADGITGLTGDGPIDMGLSPNDGFLYVLNTRDDSITILAVGAGGQLTPVDSVTGLPAAVVGLAVR